MLNYLKISNFALIENAEVDFSSGFSVFTGESGAGKSIFMSAIAMLTGGRAEKSGIRTGCRQYTVSGEFSIPPALRDRIATQLEAAGIDFDPADFRVTIRRVVGTGGTRNFLNDAPVGAKLLAEIGELLIDLHGANEQISLLHPAHQLELLDNYGGLTGMRESCRKIQQELNALAAARAEFDRNLPDADTADRMALIAEEIDRIAPAPGEDRELGAKQRLGANAREVLETLGRMCNILTENENGVADQLGTVYHDLSELEKIDPSLTGDALRTCAELQTAVAELSGNLASLGDKVELDPEALAAAEARLSELHTLKRRYGPTLEQVLTTRDEAAAKVKEFQQARARREEFDARKEILRRQLRDAAAELSAARRRTATEFLDKTMQKLAAIGFNGAKLEADFTAVEPGSSGMDRMELMFNANKGEELRPLRKIASSGELSRLMLALKTVLADADAVPTVIFDEIDMNIGGETANKVGRELAALGRRRQILCISHLAQVAARADHHFKVEKSDRNGRTVSRIVSLDDPVPELARMLGGGASALDHAGALHRELHSR
ncbi:MAG: DNA repair protein RecN [Lentisphaeria bacterium]|nr:DNA repair protein RecN [Lentisphaeria bacterium]